MRKEPRNKSKREGMWEKLMKRPKLKFQPNLTYARKKQQYLELYMYIYVPFVRIDFVKKLNKMPFVSESESPRFASQQGLEFELWY